MSPLTSWVRGISVICLLHSPLAYARHDLEICGTHSLRTQEEVFLHQRSQARGRTRHGSAVVVDFGEIAVLDDSDGVVALRNPFDLEQKTVTFTPSNATASSYTFQTSAGSYDSTTAAAGTKLLLSDDDTQRVRLPFAFPYFGVSYQELYVNSDGNLTFTSGDSASTDRSLGRFDEGQPRIAVFYTDLNPEGLLPGVFVTSSPDGLVVSWVAVPPYSHSTANPQTFQVRLYPSGRIEMTWSVLTLSDGVVGLSPGKLIGTAALVSFSQGSSQTFSSAVADRFAASNAVDVVTTAQRFYQTHEDSYDYLVIFNAEGIPAAEDVQSYALTTRNSGSGYGVDIIEQRGSAARLQAVLNMGPLSQYPSDPNAVLPFRATSGDTTLTLLGHQTGHLFLANVSVSDPTNANARPMLGRGGTHWSFLYDSEASLLEGNRIMDMGATASPRFLTTATVAGYSPLDQYLMGLRLPAEVPDTFWVSSPTGGISPAQPPQKGISFDGQSQDVKIENLISVAGRRTPDATVAQKNFRFAFVLIVAAGQTPTSTQLAQLDNYRSHFEAAYDMYTSNRAVADTTLKKALHLSTFPASGVLTGSTVNATITLEQATTSALAITLASGSAAVMVPASVTIPVGATSGTFTITGVSAGVAQLTAHPADPAYETALVNIQAGTPGLLELKLVSGDSQAGLPGKPLPSPVVVRLVDRNALPYPGLHLMAAASGGGTVDADLVTDANGLATFHWTLGTDDANMLTVSLPKGGPSLKVAASLKPDFTAGSVVNAASYATGLCPGSIATIFGTHLDAGTVAINDEPATVFYASALQINFLVPADIPVGSATVKVTNAKKASNQGAVPVVALQPGLFAAVNLGTYAQLYATGLGTVQSPQVTVGGVTATVLYSGIAPGFVGLSQVNALLPAGVSPTADVVLKVSGLTSNVVKMQ